MLHATYRGKRRRTSTKAKVLVTAATGAGVALGILGTSGAAHADGWDQVAQCESSGNWHANTGNGFYGGLQFTQSTWQAYGGGKYAPRADEASQAQQKAVASRVLAGQGRGAWPVCNSRAGSLGGSTSAPSGSTSSHTSSSHSTSSAPSSSSSSTSHSSGSSYTPHHAATSAKSNPNGDYTVKSGDTLSKIAAAHHVSGGYQAIVSKNQGYISNPNLILVGQKIAL